MSSQLPIPPYTPSVTEESPACPIGPAVRAASTPTIMATATRLIGREAARLRTPHDLGAQAPSATDEPIGGAWGSLEAQAGQRCSPARSLLRASRESRRRTIGPGGGRGLPPGAG